MKKLKYFLVALFILFLGGVGLNIFNLYNGHTLIASIGLILSLIASIIVGILAIGCPTH
jgi:purine-cytosine permease-like protein